MKILNLHGLNGSCHNTNYEFLSKYYEGNDDVEIISPLFIIKLFIFIILGIIILI